MSKIKLALLTFLIAVSHASFAVVDPNITTAVTNASDNTTAVSAGVVTIAAVFFGIGLVVAWMRK